MYIKPGGYTGIIYDQTVAYSQSLENSGKFFDGAKFCGIIFAVLFCAERMRISRTTPLIS